MEWLDFRPWSAEVAQKMAAIHAAEVEKHQRGIRTGPAPVSTQDWEKRLKSWFKRDPWGAEA